MNRLRHWNFCSQLCLLKWGGPATWYSDVERSNGSPFYRGGDCAECESPLTWAPRLTDAEVMDLLSTRAQPGGGFHGASRASRSRDRRAA